MVMVCIHYNMAKSMLCTGSDIYAEKKIFTVFK